MLKSVIKVTILLVTLYAGYSMLSVASAGLDNMISGTNTTIEEITNAK